MATVHCYLWPEVSGDLKMEAIKLVHISRVRVVVGEVEAVQK